MTFDKKSLVGIILRELDRQRDQEPGMPYFGEISSDGSMIIDGDVNIHMIADAIIAQIQS